MKQIVVLLVALALLCGLLLLVLTFFDVRSPFPLNAPAASVSVQTERLQESTDTYAIDVQYPQFGILAIDDQIKAVVEGAASEIRDYPANPPDSAVGQNTLDGNFEKVYVGPDVVSVELLLSQYTGGAHPMTILIGLNFDRATGRKLELNDALRLIGKSVADISAEATRQFRQKFADAFFAEGADTNPENYSSFVISEDKVTFMFQAYQVAAYAAGPQQVSFARQR